LNNVLNAILDLASAWKAKLEHARLARRWEKLRSMGMHLGQGVNLPASTWIDVSNCYAISIGDWCGFGEQCLILAHDAQMDEFLDAALVAKVTIHESCHFGSRTVILPGVEVGPRTIVGANSVVAKSLPSETVCAGVPAKVICSLDEYLARHQASLGAGRQFLWSEYNLKVLTPARRAEIMEALAKGSVYFTGGFSAELRGRGGTERTPYDETAAPHGVEYLRRRGRTASYRE
jgi:maltose O-acetyltransferase